MPEDPTAEQDIAAATAVKDAPEGANPLNRVETHWSEDEREQLAKLHGGVSIHEPGFIAMLATALDLGLDPLRGEIWLAEGRQWSAARNEWTVAYQPAVGRDGLLKHARSQKAFKAVRFNVVCANDTFEVEDDGWETKVLHRFASLGPAAAEQGHESEWRGEVVGAWAKLYYADDRPPLFYFAPAHEHVRTEEKIIDGGQKVESPIESWKYISAMIIKSAVSYVLRIGFGVTGIVPFDELRVDDPQFMGGEELSASGAQLDEDPNPLNAEFIDQLEAVPEALRKELKIALDQINELVPFSWSPAKVRMRLGSDCDEDKARAVLAEVEGEYKALRERKAEREDRQAAAAAPPKG